MASQPRLHTIPVTLHEANRYVSRWHRHHRAVHGCRFCLGAVDEDDAVRGVAIVGRPLARLLDDGLTAEVRRVATDGCPNACSCLYGAARRAARALGYARIITYCLADERPQRGAAGGETAGPINENEEPDTSGRDRSH